MSPLWKIVVALMVVLPVGGYVVGSLIASGAAEPDDRDTIVIDGTGPDTGSTPSERPSRDARTDDPTLVTPRPEPGADDSDTDDDTDEDTDEDEDDTYADGGPVQTRTREASPPRDGGQSAPVAPSGQGGQGGDDRTRDDDDRTRDVDDDNDDRDDDNDDDDRDDQDDD